MEQGCDLPGQASGAPGKPQASVPEAGKGLAVAGAPETPAASDGADTPAATAAPTAEDERARIQGILGSEEGKARPQVAHAVAFSTDMDLATAKAFLDQCPVEGSDASAGADEPGAALDKQVEKAGDVDLGDASASEASGDGSLCDRRAELDELNQ